MGFYNQTLTVKHITPLPPGVTKEQAMVLLQNHDWLIHMDPELESYTTMEPPPGSAPSTKFYHITDHMEALPLGLWGTTVSFNAEITNVEDGIEWIIKAPLGLLQTTKWSILPNSEGGDGLVLVEDGTISCTVVLMRTVKAKCEQNWRGIHEKFVNKLIEENKKMDGGEGLAIEVAA